MPKEEVSQAGISSRPSVLSSIEHLDLPTFTYKTIDHIAYARCYNGTIYKCMLGGCRVQGFRFQTLKKKDFVSHLERCHIGLQWNGDCSTCEKTVAAKGTIFNEFIHMRTDHLKKEEKIHTESLPSEDVTEIFGFDAESIIDSNLRELQLDETQESPDLPAQIMMDVTLQSRSTALVADTANQPSSTQSIRKSPPATMPVTEVIPSLSPDPVSNQMEVSEPVPGITTSRPKKLKLRIENVFSLQDVDANPFAWDIFNDKSDEELEM